MDTTRGKKTVSPSILKRKADSFAKAYNWDFLMKPVVFLAKITD